MKIRLSVLTAAMEAQAEQFDELFDDAEAYFDTKTGEILSVWDGMINGIHVEREEIEAIEEEEERYRSLPGSRAINEYDIMRDYIYSLPEGELQSRLFRAIDGRGAFRRFRQVIEKSGSEDQWERFRGAALEQIGRDWAEEEEIEVEEDVPSRLLDPEEEQD